MLDVARQTFLQSMEDIYQTADAMTEENGYQVKVFIFCFLAGGLVAEN